MTLTYLAQEKSKIFDQNSNIELQNVSHWLTANKLITLNVTKTQYIVFRSKKKKIDKNVDIKLDDQTIKKTDITKF